MTKTASLRAADKVRAKQSTFISATRNKKIKYGKIKSMRKITIITGASSGLGAEFARQISKKFKNQNEKREIWLIARNKEKLESVKNEICGIKKSDESEQNEAKTSDETCGDESVNSEIAENENQKVNSGNENTENENGGNLNIGNEEKSDDVESAENAKNVGNLEVKTIPMDISGKTGVLAFELFLEKEKSAGGFEIENLLNNAGFGTYGPFIETPTEREMEMVELNCTALTGICGKAIPFMKAGSGIINVASLASFMPLGNFAVYAATKAYVLSFSIALAAELKDKKIKVTALCPGSVSTGFANVASNGARKEVLHGKNPEKVVRHCLARYEKGKLLALWSAKWRFTAFMSRFFGRYACARATFLFNKRPYKKD